jgi:hypothetical protein
MAHSVPKLNDPTLLKQNVAYVNGEWVKVGTSHVGFTMLLRPRRRKVAKPSRFTVRFCLYKPCEAKSTIADGLHLQTRRQAN